MKSGKRVILAATLIAAGTLAVRGELEPWVQHTASGPAIQALFRAVVMPGGPVPILRPPAETRPALTNLIANAPRDAMLCRLRAQQDEVGLDFTAAETDWKAYAQKAADLYDAQIELANFYDRRIRPRDELSALLGASTVKDDPLLPATEQRGWRAFVRMAAVVDNDAVPAVATEHVFRAWVARYPKEPEAWRKLIDYLIAKKQFATAETEIANYGRKFDDTLEPVKMRADLELRRESPEAALAIYDRAFEPLWPDALSAGFFKLLEAHGQLREFTGRARKALAADPTNLNATARLFHYFQAQNNAAAARRVLVEYRIAKESGRQPWTSGELLTLALLFKGLPDVNEAARLYYALYSVLSASPEQKERALYELADLMFTGANQPIQFGSGDLSFYKDIATLDPSPGFLNGILSLVLNWTEPRSEYQSQNEKSAAYFHCAAGAQLSALLDQRFPKSAHRDSLHASIISAYATYGDDATVIRAGREYLAAFPKGGSRVSVAMQMASALAREHRPNEEFALYDRLLRELGARSGQYGQVLDKYLSRLAALNRPLDALRVYRTEIDRNPNDAGLYQRLAAFLEQNGMSRDVEAVYTKAIAKFSDRSWYDKLARWYLRRKEFTALEKISRDAVDVFSGSELERYFGQIVSQTHPDAALYLRLNLYAHERFPEDLAFVRNLLGAYAQKESYDAEAADRLLRQYWFYDAQLKSMFFERLSQQGRLYPELAEIRAANPEIVAGQFDQALTSNPAAVQFATEAEAWLSHFEAAAPAARALASSYPGKREFTTRASALYRSLAAYDKRDTDIALALAASELQANPRDQSILARMGDILADRDLLDRAKTFWDRMPAEQPGKPAAYLDAATVYWDYYRFTDALRWIADARKKFNDPALFAYQAGAIYEGKRDYGSAVREYVDGALHGDDPADRRLLRLLLRPPTRELVERATAAAVASDASPQAVSLRLAVLESEQHRPELEALLRARVELEKSSAELTTLQVTALRLGFESVEERASERLAAIANDPVDKMRLTLANARLLESKKDIGGGARVVDALYREHPLILGVVRGAVDFHVRNRQPAEAIDILLDAAKHARADLGAQFTLESARIATGAGQFDRARTLLSGLLAGDPLRVEYLTAMADTYLQAKDDRGFQAYELATIQQLKQSQLLPAQRIERIATVRRSLIPALNRLKDSAGAVDQYIEVLNSYPEDEQLTKEAAAYAVAHGQSVRLVAFYRQTITAAPLDYRWPVVLARIETVAEDFPAAIADYERGMKARPDRADLVEAKASLEERLMRFDDAIKSYSRLYELAYRDPQWLIKVAELRARTGQNSEAVNALKTAVIGARAETAAADFSIAEQLEAWHILSDAVSFAERGAKLAGSDLMSQFSHAVIYSRIMTRARRMDAVISKLQDNPAANPQITPEVGKIIDETYTPEEKARLEQALAIRAASLLPLAQSAGLVDVESRWRLEAMNAQATEIDQRFVTLQSQRGLYADLGRQLEAYAAKTPGQPVEANALIEAAQAFIAEGDIDSQVRVMRQSLARNALSGKLLDRYLELIASRQLGELLTIVRNHPSADIRNRAVQFAIAGGDPKLTYSAVQARGAALTPVWTKSYTALAGQYFDDRSPVIDASFRSVLDTRTIGERLKTRLNSDTVIVGSVWFYYGARYGDYLVSGHNPAAPEWLPASLEAAPGNPEAYMTLGDSLTQAGQTAKAITQFELALQLDPDRGDAYDHIARVLWSQGRRLEAIAQWKSAIATFLRIQSRGVRVPEPFWGRVAETFADLGELHALGELRGDIAHLLADYYQRNNEYRLSELIEPAASASIESGEGTAWLLDLGRSMSDPEMILNALMRVPSLTDEQRISLQRDLVAVFDNRADDVSQATGARLQLISMLLNAGNVQGAAVEWRQVPPLTGGQPRWERDQFRDDVEIRLAAKTGNLESLLERYRAEPESAPFADSLRNAAVLLRRAGDEQSARSVLAFLYDREIRTGHLEAANFLGLAEVDLQRNDNTAALALLNRMALVVEDGFETLLPAAELLGKSGQAAASADFVRRRVKAVPWDSDAKVHLARTLPSGSAEREQLLTAAATDPEAAYELRAEAARLAAPNPLTGVSGTELALLSSAHIAPADAEKPYQVESRIEAAHQASSPEIQLRLWREALALAPADKRVRLGAIRAALTLRRDSLALALEQGGQLNNQERAGLAESLAAAAERLNDLDAAETHLRLAIEQQPPDHRAELERRLKAIVAEQDRRKLNAARQPVIKNLIEQDHPVLPRILRSAQ